METILISACLMGAPCRYDGKGALVARLSELSALCTLVPVCPEVLGGLPTPRESAEALGARVITVSGVDVTPAFLSGARAAVRVARENGCRYALLKDKSPSCGVGLVYDGAFTGALIPGDGLTARALKQAGVEVYPASQIDALIALVKARA